MKETKKYYTLTIPEWEETKKEWEKNKDLKDVGVIQVEIKLVPNEPNKLQLPEKSWLVREMINFSGCPFLSRGKFVENKFSNILTMARKKHLEEEKKLLGSLENV